MRNFERALPPRLEHAYAISSMGFRRVETVEEAFEPARRCDKKIPDVTEEPRRAHHSQSPSRRQHSLSRARTASAPGSPALRGRGGGTPQSRRGKRPGACYSCGEMGHRAVQCPGGSQLRDHVHQSPAARPGTPSHPAPLWPQPRQGVSYAAHGAPQSGAPAHSPYGGQRGPQTPATWGHRRKRQHHGRVSQLSIHHHGDGAQLSRTRARRSQASHHLRGDMGVFPLTRSLQAPGSVRTGARASIVRQLWFAKGW